MAQVSDKDIASIKSWLAKEPLLPKDIDDVILKKLLFSCHCSLERTKKCIEQFCTSRATMNEIFTDRDPLSNRMQTSFAISSVSTYTAGVDEILIHRLQDVDKFEFYDSLKSFMILADNWLLLKKDVLPENHIILIDIKVYTLMMATKFNIFFLHKFITFLLEAMPVRLKAVHVINCPSYTEYLYGLVKGILPQDIRNIISFHSDHTALHKYIDKKYLPIEYDGEAESMVAQNASWVEEICQKRKFYTNDDLWKADIGKKGKNGPVETTITGSFKSLAID